MDEKYFIKKYICYILYLTIKMGIKTPSVDQLIMKFKDSHHHIYSNNIRK
jgi:hypothetical protein